MKIAITEKLKPFSHIPGTKCLLPGTNCIVQAFPVLVRVDGLEPLHLGVHGPVANFTVEQDLEKNCVSVFGKAQEGFYCLRIQAYAEGISLFIDRCPTQGIAINGINLLRKETKFFPIQHPFFLPASWERLSFGCARKQEWDLVLKRFDLKEILPVLFALGQKMPQQQVPAIYRGTARLLGQDLTSFCRAAFSSLCVPRLCDEDHQGLVPEEAIDENPGFLLTEVFAWIRRLHFVQDHNQIVLLPRALFDAGRLIGVRVEGIGIIDIEWASFQLRRIILRCMCSDSLFFSLPNQLHSFRVRSSLLDKGRRHVISEPFLPTEGRTYFLDRFQK